MRCGLCGFLIIKLQTALHHAVWCSTVQYYLWCSAICGFIIRKPHKLHRTTSSLYINIFNIKYIINSLITLVFKRKK